MKVCASAWNMFYRAIFLFCLIVSTVSGDSKSPRIIIVGAGASGIAAAAKLLENGFDDVLILEAENRIGGRVNTVKLDEYWIDLGAQWIHGEKGNVVYELVAPLNITEHSVPFVDNVYTSTGELVDLKIARNISNVFFDYFETTSDILHTLEGCDKSIGECVEKKLQSAFEVFPELNDTMKEQWLWHFNAMQISMDPADDWYDISAKDYTEYRICEGDQAIHWKPGGARQLLDVLMKKFPNPEEELPVLNKTILNTEVTKVDYSKEDGTVEVSTLDGNKYTAEHVIMTPSLGVLKAQYETLFNPQLPESKVTSIKGLGFGNACQIYLAFNDTWFRKEGSDNVGGYRILWSKEERERLNSDPKTRWMPYAVGYFFVVNRPRLLSIWVSGKGARLMDDLTDDEVLEQSTQMLQNLLSKDYNVTKPLAMKRSTWHQNKHFRGTYSYRSMETVRTNSSALELSKPIEKNGKPVVLFGGEATNPHMFSTVHGAVASGWREAERLMNLYKENDSTTETAVTK